MSMYTFILFSHRWKRDNHIDNQASRYLTCLIKVMLDLAVAAVAAVFLDKMDLGSL
jgi:hypothetical protein